MSHRPATDTIINYDSTNQPGFVVPYAQENPEGDEQPERAPLGIEFAECEDNLKLAAEIVLCTLVLPHLLHVILALLSLDKIICSKTAPHLSHLYS